MNKKQNNDNEYLMFIGILLFINLLRKKNNSFALYAIKMAGFVKTLAGFR
jgi:hypothetical protein